MNIKRSIHIALKTRKYKGKKVIENLPIRIRVCYDSKRLEILTGYSVDLAMWDEGSQRVKKNTVNRKKEKASDINAFLNKACYEIDEAIKEFEVVDRIPTKKELEETYLRRMEGKIPEKKIRKASHFWLAMNQFKITESKKNSWQYSTIQKFNALEKHIKAYKEQPRFEDFNDRGITAFIGVLIDKEGLSNSTVLKQLGYLKWFLQWAAVNKYHCVMDFKNYKPHLATTKKRVIFLTIDEIKKLLATKIPENRPGLERVRDVFVFCCFTGLRHSDVYNLRRSDIKDDSIEVTTKKTADSLIIDLNNVSKGILEKYKGFSFPDDKALPVISNQKMNDQLKDLCELAGFTEEIRITTYQGGKRTDVIKKKHELIRTHAARRSFICNSLAAGIPVNVVMKWTGHSNYKAMEPYIDVADSIKAKEMDKMNNLIASNEYSFDRENIVGEWIITQAKFDPSATMTPWDLDRTVFILKENGFFQTEGFFGKETGAYSIKGNAITINVRNQPFIVLDVENVKDGQIEVVATIQSSKQLIWMVLSHSAPRE